MHGGWLTYSKQSINTETSMHKCKTLGCYRGVAMRLLGCILTENLSDILVSIYALGLSFRVLLFRI